MSMLCKTHQSVGVEYQKAQMEVLKKEISKICAEEQLVCGEGEEEGAAWLDKVIFHILP